MLTILVFFFALCSANPLSLSAKQFEILFQNIEMQSGSLLSEIQKSAISAAVNPELLQGFSSPPEAYDWFQGCLLSTAEAVRDGGNLTTAILFDFFFQVHVTLLIRQNAELRLSPEYSLLEDNNVGRCNLLKTVPDGDLYKDVKLALSALRLEPAVFQRFLQMLWGV